MTLKKTNVSPDQLNCLMPLSLNCPSQSSEPLPTASNVKRTISPASTSMVSRNSTRTKNSSKTGLNLMTSYCPVSPSWNKFLDFWVTFWSKSVNSPSLSPRPNNPPKKSKKSDKQSGYLFIYIYLFLDSN